MKKPLSKEELVARLKALAADPTPKEENYGAMCYSQMSPPQKQETCQLCGKEFVYRSWHKKEDISELVEKMKKKGYDVKLDVLCLECGEEMVKKIHPNCLYSRHDSENDNEDIDDDNIENDIWPTDINFLFSFRTNNDVPYHQVIANYTNLYRTLYTLMENKRMYNDSHDASHYIDEETETLQFMTGINFDE
jgi:hypothetical protein